MFVLVRTLVSCNPLSHVRPGGTNIFVPCVRTYHKCDIVVYLVGASVASFVSSFCWSFRPSVASGWLTPSSSFEELWTLMRSPRLVYPLAWVDPVFVGPLDLFYRGDACLYFQSGLLPPLLVVGGFPHSVRFVRILHTDVFQCRLLAGPLAHKCDRLGARL